MKTKSWFYIGISTLIIAFFGMLALDQIPPEFLQGNVGNTAPTAPSISNPLDGDYVTSPNIAVNGTVVANENVTVVQWRRDQGNWVNAGVQGNTWSMTDTLPGEGNYIYEFKAITNLSVESNVSILNIGYDLTAPAIADSDPQDGDTGVFINSIVIVQFDENLDPSSVNDNTVTNCDGPTIANDMAFYTDTLTITPKTQLVAGGLYCLKIQGVRDMAGNEMTQAVEIEFETDANGATGQQSASLNDGTSITIAPDGKQTITDPDGTITEIFPDGTIKVTETDGTITETFPDGRVKVTDPNGKVTETFPDGRVVVTDTDGKVTETLPNGTVKVTLPDGTITITYPNGTVLILRTDGTTTVNYADTSVLNIAADGSLILTLPDGTKIAVSTSGQMTITLPDNTSTTSLGTLASTGGIVTLPDTTEIKRENTEFITSTFSNSTTLVREDIIEVVYTDTNDDDTTITGHFTTEDETEVKKNTNNVVMHFQTSEVATVMLPNSRAIVVQPTVSISTIDTDNSVRVLDISSLNNNQNGNDITLGDVNDDNVINAQDALEILKYVINLVTNIDNDRADTNSDNTVSTLDALEILKYNVCLDNSIGEKDGC